MSPISVVIPTLNEAANLAELLPQLREQTLAPREVVVADANSDDGTDMVAERWGSRLVEGGRPAQARNAGALACSGRWLFFLDADTRLPGQGFLQAALRELERQGVAAAISDVRAYYGPQDKGHGRVMIRAWDRVMTGVQSRGQRAWLSLGFPVGTAQFMAVRREVFMDLGGFSAQAEPFEDSEMLLRIHRKAPPAPGSSSSVGILDKTIFVLISMRRFDVQGRFLFPLRLSLRATLMRRLLGRELPLPDYWDINHRGFPRQGQGRGPGS